MKRSANLLRVWQELLATADRYPPPALSPDYWGEEKEFAACARCQKILPDTPASLHLNAALLEGGFQGRPIDLFRIDQRSHQADFETRGGDFHAG